MKDIEKIQELIGSADAEDLKYVDCAVSEHFGIFVPSVGFCNLAITPKHVHPAYMFNIFLAPEQTIVEQKLKVPENQYLAIALSPGVPHQEEQGDSFKRYYAVMVSKDYFDKLYFTYTKERPPEYIWKQFLVSSDIMFYMKQFIYEYENKVCNSDQVLQSLTSIITHKLVRSLLEINLCAEPVSSIHGVEKTEQYIQQHFGEKITVSMLAEAANMSASHFIRTFKREIGISPMEYLIRVRIDKGKKLLNINDRSITEISLRCGFSSTSHFSSCFLKQTGLTPTEYRNKFAKL